MQERRINMSECIKRFLEKYPPETNLVKPDDKILEFAKKILPQEIIELWENYGFGDYGNGIIKVIDPRHYMHSLYTWLGKKDFTKIPIMMTAFGDIFYYRKLPNNLNDISLLNVHYGKLEVCSYSYQEFFGKYIINEIVRKEILREELFYQAKKQVGELAEKEIYFFVPAILFGIPESIKRIKKGNAPTHHQLLFKMRTGEIKNNKKESNE